MEMPMPNTNTEASMEQYTGLVQTKSDDLIRWILSPQTRVEEFVRTLSGYQKDMEGKWVVNNGVGLIINDRGQSFLIGLLKGFMSPDVIMTRYDDDDMIRKMIQPMMDDVIFHLNTHKSEYNMDDSHVRIINHAISNLMIATLRRGLKQGERNFLNLNTRIETKQTQEAGNKIPFIGGLLGGKR